MKHTITTLWAFALFTLLSGATFSSAQDEPKAKPKEEPKAASGNVMTILDAKGNERKLTKWKFLEGTRELTWLAPKAAPKNGEEKKEGEDKQPAPAPEKPKGPDALIFREKNSTNFKEGILTLVPLSSLRSLTYDYEEKTATAKVATSEKAEDDITLTGSAAEFVGINTITIQAEVDLGDLGIAELKYRGGVKEGIQGLQFSAPKPWPAVKGLTTRITINDDAEKPDPRKVKNLQVMYSTRTRQQVLSTKLFFRKTIKVDLSKLAGLKKADELGNDWELALSSGDTQTFTLLDPAMLDGQTVFFGGFLGQVPAGYQLYPKHVIKELKFGGEKVEN